MAYQKSDFEIGSLGVGINPNEIQRAIANVLGPIVQAQVAKEKVGHDKAAEWFGEGGLLPEAGEFQIGSTGGLTVKVVIEPEGGYHGQVLEHDPVKGVGVTGVKLKKHC
ncbi:hypothetical protein LL254_00440 [Marinobacter nauticus]|uniref:hypothetical protein n=1 Tax=Marinobacter nauticus TaxID=2743 RepID=UPI001D18A8F0|nr:hypothetical protein [Marinobacter nauticus]MCC4269174.1 hypothetical protein [Marinobacter nauticus]